MMALRLLGGIIFGIFRQIALFPGLGYRGRYRCTTLGSGPMQFIL
jgi:hypothetical protein